LAVLAWIRLDLLGIEKKTRHGPAKEWKEKDWIGGFRSDFAEWKFCASKRKIRLRHWFGS
jgi:hypothetical protein